MRGYSFLVHSPIAHKGKLYLAKVEDSAGRFEFNLALMRGEHPDLPLPSLSILLDTTGPRLDYLPIINLQADLSSQRFMDTLAGADVSVIAYPAEVVDVQTHERLAEPYWVWRPYTMTCIDWERSKFAEHPVFHRQELAEVVLSDVCLQAAPPLFADPKYSEWLIRNDVGRLLVDAGLTGMEFYALDMPLYQRAQPEGKLVPGSPYPPE